LGVKDLDIMQGYTDDHVSESLGSVEKEQFGGLGFGLILFGGLGL